jgi:hypothetical protein
VLSKLSFSFSRLHNERTDKLGRTKKAGSVSHKHPKRFYKYALIDPLDQPYTTFRYICMPWYELRASHGIECPPTPVQANSGETMPAPLLLGGIGALGEKGRISSGEDKPRRDKVFLSPITESSVESPVFRDQKAQDQKQMHSSAQGSGVNSQIQAINLYKESRPFRAFEPGPDQAADEEEEQQTTPERIGALSPHPYSPAQRSLSLKARLEQARAATREAREAIKSTPYISTSSDENLQNLSNREIPGSDCLYPQNIENTQSIPTRVAGMDTERASHRFRFGRTLLRPKENISVPFKINTMLDQRADSMLSRWKHAVSPDTESSVVSPHGPGVELFPYSTTSPTASFTSSPLQKPVAPGSANSRVMEQQSGNTFKNDNLVRAKPKLVFTKPRSASLASSASARKGPTFHGQLAASSSPKLVQFPAEQMGIKISRSEKALLAGSASSDSLAGFSNLTNDLSSSSLGSLKSPPNLSISRSSQGEITDIISKYRSGDIANTVSTNSKVNFTKIETPMASPTFGRIQIQSSPSETLYSTTSTSPRAERTHSHSSAAVIDIIRTIPNRQPSRSVARTGREQDAHGQITIEQIHTHPNVGTVVTIDGLGLGLSADTNASSHAAESLHSER